MLHIEHMHIDYLPHLFVVQTGWYAALRSLLEGAVERAGGHRAAVVCHGAGCLVLWYMLAVLQGPDWRCVFGAKKRHPKHLHDSLYIVSSFFPSRHACAMLHTPAIH